MGVVYAGSTPKYLIKIKDENGAQLDPSNVVQISEVKVFLYNAITGAMIAKFYLNSAPQGSGWVQMETEQAAVGDVRVQFYLTSAQTIAAEGNSNMIQVNVHFPDDDVAGGTRIEIKKGKFHEIKPAQA